MEYTVVEKYTLVELIEQVNRLLKAGWIPFGDLVVGTNFYQPMIKGDIRKIQEADEKNPLVN